MEKAKRLEQAKACIEQLAKGDSALGQEEVSRCLAYVLELLEKVGGEDGGTVPVSMGDKDEVEVKRVYRHFKGKWYYVHDLVVDSETREEMVSYQPLYPPYSMFVRPKSMFLESIDPNREGNVTGQRQRFQRVDP